VHARIDRLMRARRCAGPGRGAAAEAGGRDAERACRTSSTYARAGARSRRSMREAVGGREQGRRRHCTWILCLVCEVLAIPSTWLAFCKS
jgi:hypothetical protein